MKGCGVEEFKENLDKFLKTIPDEPKIGGAMPMNSRQSNSIIHQMERGEWKTVDPAGSHHLSKADSEDMLLVLTVQLSMHRPKRTMHVTFKICFSSVNKVQTFF